MDEQRERCLREERAELQAANDAAPGWGAAFGVRAGRIREIDRLLGEDNRRMSTDEMLRRVGGSTDLGGSGGVEPTGDPRLD